MTTLTKTLGRFRSRTLRKASTFDWVMTLWLLLLCVAAVASGRRAASGLSVEGAKSAKALAHAMNLPGRLSNSPVQDREGRKRGLYSYIQHDRAIVTFYAPWCGPCQEELQELATNYKSLPVDLLVVIGENEDPVETTQKLKNLGLGQTSFLIDHTGQLARTAQVSSLPTTFAISPQGKVLLRLTGYSYMGMYQLSETLDLDELQRQQESAEASAAEAKHEAAKHD